MRNVLITGGAGFIGSCLANMLLQQGDKVCVYDNFSAGNRKFLASGVRIIEGDILDRIMLVDSIRSAEANIVFHLAAYHFIPFCDAHPEETLRCNVEGTHSVLHACVEAGVKQAVVASSGALYIDKAGLITEEDPIAAFDVYSLSKIMAESCAKFVAKQNNLNAVVTRLFNTFGPNETQDHLIPAIVQQLKCGPHLVLGNIETKRDYIYVEDVANALIACANIHQDHYTVVNVGTGIEHSAREIVEVISRMLGIDLEVTISNNLIRKNDKRHQTASYARLNQLTGWQPRFSIESGLQALLEFEGLL